MKTTPLFQPAMAGALFALVFALAACSHSGSSDQTNTPLFIKHQGQLLIPANSPLRKRLKIAGVAAQMIAHTVTAPATVEAEPSRTVNIVAPLSGRLVALKVSLGQTVRRGDTLALIASGDMAQAYSDDDKARDGLNLAAKALRRARGVQSAGGEAIKDLEAAQSAYNQALAEAHRASMRLASLSARGGGPGLLRITAPCEGTITALSAAAGDYLSDPTASLMTLNDLSEVWISADVAEDKLAGMRPGLPAKVRLAAYPGVVLDGTVRTVDPILNSDTRRSRVRLAFDNRDGQLKPNMFASVSIAEPEAQQVLVPQSALLMNNDNVSVFVETRPWTFVRRKLAISYDENAWTRVTSGLKGGERIIVSGGVLLNDD